MDNSLNWREDMKVVSFKVSKALVSLKHSKICLAVTSLKALYLNIVEPHLRRSQLQRLQNRAARKVTNSGSDIPGNFLTKSLDWKIIDELISWDSKLIVFKPLNNQAPQ